MKNYVKNFQLLLLISLLSTLVSFAQKADLILTNGKVFTSDTSQFLC